ncbi:putative uncharacterized protein [Parasutterella excrementihominis CAG:233]|nr:putative uncharacterized protein [Parasutterella excrementihominis CAG:233]
MVRENQRTLTGDKNTIFGIHSVSLQVVDFLQHCFGANNCTVTDVALDVRMHNTGGDQTKNRFLAVDHECVACIVAAVETDNALYTFGEPVNDLAFAFVAPLSADNDYIFTHFILLKN